ncbi:MAG: reverse transcriptase domain-containing protein [Patescibacteria group bacterium]
MLFENLLEQAARTGAAAHRKSHLDRNPLSGQTKVRILYKPNEAMKRVHWRLINYIRELRRGHISEYTAPFSLSPLKNLQRHRRARFFWLLDIQHAYERVDLDRLVEVLAHFDPFVIGQEAAVREFLEKYCFSNEGGLATGACASPDLFNIYVGKLVDEPLWQFLRAYASKTGDEIRYSRYIDDLTLSAQQRPWGASVRRNVKRIVAAAGLPLHRRKVSPSLDLRRGPILITGLRLAWPGRIFIPRHYLQLFRNRLRTAIREVQLEGDFSIQKLGGMNGVFRSGLAAGQKLTRQEEDVAFLWQEYRRLWKTFNKRQH